jgi:3-deoxy-7-phosphoheptulonate synthase
MILRLKPGLKAGELSFLRRRLAALLPGSQFVSGRGFITVFVSAPEPLNREFSTIENLPGIASAELSMHEACPLTVKAAPPDLTALSRGHGRGNFILIAGPCTVEDEHSYLETAKELKAAGVCSLRAGLFKPRTSPYAFQGLGAKGFPIVKKARRATGLAAVTEATSESQLPRIRKTCGIVQIGARNMRNYELLKAAARSGMPVLLKRAPGATLKEWLLSAEYLLAHGNGEIILCERGDSFSRPNRLGLNLEMLRAALNATALPVIADPCHATGNRTLAASQAMAAVRAGADGLMLEVSVNPAAAVMDGRQTLSLHEFTALLRQLAKLKVWRRS